MKMFPCYGCANMGEEVPRCRNWKSCKAYRGLLRSNGIKGVAMYVAGLIAERRKAAQAGEG